MVATPALKTCPPAPRQALALPLQYPANRRGHAAALEFPRAGKNGFTLSREQSIPAEQPLPVNLVGRDWKMLFQPKLNIAWLPVDQVFLRVVQLPVSDLDETLAMVELQLEKLSPLPVTQMVWSVQMLPHKAGNLQSVIVVMMARDLVEKFLGELEGQGLPRQTGWSCPPSTSCRPPPPPPMALTFTRTARRASSPRS